MITFLIITNIIFITLFLVSLWKLLQQSGNLLELEDARENDVIFFEEAKNIMMKVHDNIDKVSKYPVMSNEPIIHQLVKTVKESREDISNLVNKFVKEGSDESERNTETNLSSPGE